MDSQNFLLEERTPELMQDPKRVAEYLYATGHLAKPFGKPQDYPKSPGGRAKLRLTDACVVNAVQSLQSFDANFDFVSQMIHNRPCVPDGELGPASRLVMANERCGEPDYYPKVDYEAATLPAVGNGNWPRCHNIGDFHACSVRILNNPPSFLEPHFQTVLDRVVQSYAEIGLRFYFDGRSPVNIDFSFVNRSTGWIGLAIVGQNQSCNSKIWCKYLASYRGGSSAESIITQWTTLIKHELGHNCGRSHTRGGVMNPSIVNGLPISWLGDPSYNYMVSRFGGKPVPTGKPGEKKMVLAWEDSLGALTKIQDVPLIPKDDGGAFPRV